MPVLIGRGAPSTAGPRPVAKDRRHVFHDAHADDVLIDFTNPRRKTLLLGLHEQSQSLQLSRDGGNTWTNIGGNLPANSNHSTDPLILDSKTFLINTAGWKPKATLGIYRTEDGGQTWKPVSADGPQGPALVASDGAIYRQRVWGGAATLRLVVNMPHRPDDG